MPVAQAAKIRNTITLKGSAQIVSEFFKYAVSSILYQRGVYPSEAFEPKHQYGLSIMTAVDEGLSDYLSSVCEQMIAWLEAGILQKLILVITNAQTKEVVERWSFQVETDEDVLQGGPAPEKAEKEIRSEIQNLIRQITGSVTFLPLLNDPCTFDLLVYTSRESDAVPDQWEESDPRFIRGAENVQLRSFTTKVHRVDASVTYKASES